MTEDWQNGGFGLYIHWPFCQSKCPYCDFNSHVADTIDQKRWQSSYLSEIDRVSALTQGRALNSVFFGGGTPSLMDPDVVDAILTRVRESWPISNNIEVTLEANPSSVEAGRFAGYRDAGINRVSMGVQALNDGDLRRLGRMHSAAEALTAFDTARGVFDRVSFDLIYARQGQDLDAWRAELDRALALAIDHLSLYQLTIEDGTVFGERHKRGQLRDLPSDDLSADMYELTQDRCDAAGLTGYEVSNHARPDAQSRHNLVYWRYGDYAGIGPGAHGRLTLAGDKWATEAYRQPGKWLSAVEGAGDGTSVHEQVSLPDQATEFLLMGLRLSEGVDMGRYESLAGNPLDDNKINGLSELGLLLKTDDRLSATPRGRIVLNGILRELLGDS